MLLNWLNNYRVVEFYCSPRFEGKVYIVFGLLVSLTCMFSMQFAETKTKTLIEAFVLVYALIHVGLGLYYCFKRTKPLKKSIMIGWSYRLFCKSRMLFLLFRSLFVIILLVLVAIEVFTFEENIFNTEEWMSWATKRLVLLLVFASYPVLGYIQFVQYSRAVRESELGNVQECNGVNGLYNVNNSGNKP